MNVKYIKIFFLSFTIFKFYSILIFSYLILKAFIYIKFIHF